jgi:hypothetical protein
LAEKMHHQLFSCGCSYLFVLSVVHSLTLYCRLQPVKDLPHLLSGGNAATNSVSSPPGEYVRARGDGGDGVIPAASLHGIYPNASGHGIGRGHVFALLELAAQVEL